MVLLIHILSAMTSLAVGAFVFFRPSVRLLNACYGMVALTLASGTYLVLSRPLHILSVCLSGLIYIGAVSLSLLGARKRLASLKSL